MGTDKSVQNQKVFVTLKGVLELQDLFRLVSGRTRATTQEKDDLAF